MIVGLAGPGHSGQMRSERKESRIHRALTLRGDAPARPITPQAIHSLAMADRYGRDVLANPRQRSRRSFRDVEATDGLVVEDEATGFCGAIVGLIKNPDGQFARLEDRHGRVRNFKLRTGAFLLDGEQVTLVRPRPQPSGRVQTASGSRRVEGLRARTARAGRIWVEGIHDAALVEKIWGHDLRVEGVVVEPLGGIDHLADRVAQFAPSAQARLGILVDHLVDGSKESRLVQNLGPHVLVTGHPYVDIWQAVKPQVVGIAAWPEVPLGEDWKTGVCRRVGWGDPRDAFAHILSKVSSFRDIEPPLMGAVEQLVDFVTA